VTSSLEIAFSGWAFLNETTKTDSIPLHVPISCAILPPNGGRAVESIALLDTGAAYSVLSCKVANDIDVRSCSPDLQDQLLSTRHGKLTGHVYALDVQLLADQGGDLVIPGRFFVSDDWPGPTVIAWKSCLEYGCFALDGNSSPYRFYFGAGNGSNW
jgi:hypothetical protein